VQSQFLLFVRQHANNWLTACVLGRPEFAAFGPRLAPLKDQLALALRTELSTGALTQPTEHEYENLARKTLPIELRAVQHDRLIRVPMRFTVLHWPSRDDTDTHSVLIPRLQRQFRIVGKDNILPWAEEVIRGHFHLDSVEQLLPYQFERGERLEPLAVTWHGAKAARKKSARGIDRELPPPTGELGRVGIELVEEAKQGRLRRAWHREAELAELTGVLAGGGTTGVLLVGGTGVGKTALVHELAYRITEERVAPRLVEIPIWHVTAGRILAGMRWLGQWQQRALEIVGEVRSARGILYLDNLLEIVLALGQRSGLSLSQFFLPYLLAGELTVICEANPDALVAAEAHDAAFVRAFRRISVEPLGNAEAYEVLETAAGRLGKEHKVVFTPPALHRALDVLARFGDADGLPGSGLGLIEQMARGGASATASAPRELHAADAISTFARASGFPESLVDPDALLDVARVRGFFSERIIGQDDAVDVLTNLVTIVKAGLNDPEKPLGSFLFMGPTGVGKTESTLTLAQYLFGDRDRLIRLDMSEYGYPGAAARLIGGGPGGEGELTRRVREQPFTVILLDEVEKAAPEVFDLFLQVLGEGRLTDATGRTVRFAHTIVVMTSNLGASAPTPIGVRGGDSQEAEAIRYREAARQYFRPEFLNRVDFVIPFGALDAASLRAIARRMLDAAIGREGLKRRDVSVTYNPRVLDRLAAEGFEPKYGARPMKRAIERLVLVPLAERLASGAIAAGSKVDVQVGEAGFEFVVAG
jgi:ATP-dependent Clp protease ATP-binding subunit ClpC